SMRPSLGGEGGPFCPPLILMQNALLCESENAGFDVMSHTMGCRPTSGCARSRSSCCSPISPCRKWTLGDALGVAPGIGYGDGTTLRDASPPAWLRDPRGRRKIKAISGVNQVRVKALWAGLRHLLDRCHNDRRQAFGNGLRMSARRPVTRQQRRRSSVLG